MIIIANYKKFNLKPTILNPIKIIKIIKNKTLKKINKMMKIKFLKK